MVVLNKVSCLRITNYELTPMSGKEDDPTVGVSVMSKREKERDDDGPERS